MDEQINSSNTDEIIIELINSSIEEAKKLKYSELVQLLSRSLTRISNSRVSDIISEIKEALMLYLANNPSQGFNRLSQLIEALGSYSAAKNYGKWSGLGQLGHQ